MSRILNVRPMAGPKIEICKDEKFYKAWGKAHPLCQACGNPCKTVPRTISTHHIIKFKRSHEACNLFRLCLRCHNLAELLRLKDEKGYPLPTLTIGIILTLKRIRDPEAWDPDRLQVLFGQKLPDLALVPSVIEVEYRANRPIPYLPTPDELVDRRCGICKCTQDDCRQCIKKTGAPCWWIDLDLCSACVEPAIEPTPASLPIKKVESDFTTKEIKETIAAVAKPGEDKRCGTCSRKGNKDPRRDCSECRKRGAL